MGWFALIVLAVTACAVSLLTFFSGFGLGTVLTPVFAIWFRIDVAIALTAVVHLLNNLFKLALVGRSADWKVVARFGAPALVTAALGAGLLVEVSKLDPLWTYSLMGYEWSVLPIKLLVGVLIVCFTLLEALPQLKKWTVSNPAYIPMGGALSGFFGGLSGHQGALRSVFLVRLGLSKTGFVATGVAIACLVDVVRISVYARAVSHLDLGSHVVPLVVATLSAFLGAYAGSKVLEKVTLESVQCVVSACLIALAIALGAGWI